MPQEIPVARRLLSYEETAHRLHCSKQEVRRKVARKDIKPPLKLGKRARAFFEHEIDAYLDACAAKREVAA